MISLNPLSVPVGYSPHKGDVPFSCCGASYRQNHYKCPPSFCKRRKFATKWCISICVHVKSIARNRVAKIEFKETKTDFRKSSLSLNGLHTGIAYFSFYLSQKLSSLVWCVYRKKSKELLRM